jgi:hypothetical protein
LLLQGINADLAARDCVLVPSLLGGLQTQAGILDRASLPFVLVDCDL